MKTTFLLALAISSAAYCQANFAGSINDNYTTGDTLTATTLNNIKSAVIDNDTRATALEAARDDLYSWVITHATGAPPKYAVGDVGPGGGRVFKTTHGGIHGYEAAMEDHGTMVVWKIGALRMIGAQSNGEGAGEMNTMLIVASPPSVPTQDYAAGICATFKSGISNSVLGKADWYLPSYYELERMSHFIGFGALGDEPNTGGFKPDEPYWSSTEHDSFNAAYHLFNQGAASQGNNGGKQQYANVRCVREF